MKKVMAIGAHPDDIEFGCGGTLMRHLKSGDDVVYVCMTNTESKSGTTGDVLRTHNQLLEEVKCATDKLGINSLEFLDFKDFKTSIIALSVTASTPENGSSKRYISASCARALAKNTLCC